MTEEHDFAPAPYCCSNSAYLAIHEALAWGVECMVDNAEYEEAMKLANLMAVIEDILND